MILIGFAVVCGGLLVMAQLAGGASTMINLDSFFIVVFCAVAFAMFTQKQSAVVRGLKDIVSLKRHIDDKSEEVKKTYLALAIATVAIGVCFTFQGFGTAVLRLGGDPRSLFFPEVFAVTGLTTLYACLIAVFLFMPVYFRHR